MVRRGALSGAVFLVVRCCSAAVDVAVGKFKLFSALFSCLFFLLPVLYIYFGMVFSFFSAVCLGNAFVGFSFAVQFPLTLSFREREIFGKGKEQSKYNTAIKLKKKKKTGHHSNYILI